MEEVNSAMDRTVVANLIRKFIAYHFPSARRRPLLDSDTLLESGIIDSLGVLDMVGFIESEFHVTVADEELVPENFESIDRIVAYVAAKKNGSA